MIYKVKDFASYAYKVKDFASYAYKAISLKQPWANLVASGKKIIETRKWKTAYRGDIVVCSSKNPDIEPAGQALCVAELYHLEPMKKEHEKKACVKVYPGAYSWFLRNIRPIVPPVPVKGELGVFNLSGSAKKRILASFAKNIS